MTAILLPVFLLSIVLLGIHSFFGLEVIRRGIIFTDLAIGQMAAMGGAVSVLALEGRFLYPLALLFALGAALLIAVGRQRTAHLEAFIGILYAFGLSGVFLLLSQSAHGLERFNELLAADILFTPPAKIFRVALWYAFLGLLLRFLLPRLRNWMRDVFFFSVFALTVTSSVELAGVLVVFAILVGPASIVVNIRAKRPLPVAWGIGTIINLAAILVSYRFDLPTGYTLVFCHALAALGVFLISGKSPPAVERSERRSTE
jgi:zinc/manganese transport system permease protein